MLSEIKIQELADKATNVAMTDVYGERFTNLDNLEDDKELSDVWDSLNEQFYSTLENEFGKF